MRRALRQRRRRRAGEKGGAARAAGAAQGRRRAWRARSRAPAGPSGAPRGRRGSLAGSCQLAALEPQPSIAGCSGLREKPACIGAERRRRCAGFRPPRRGSAPGHGGPAAGSEEPEACGASDSALGTRGCGPACWVWRASLLGLEDRKRREGKGRTAGAGPRPRPLRGRAGGSARLSWGPRSHSRRRRWGMRVTAPPGSRTLLPRARELLLRPPPPPPSSPPPIPPPHPS